MIKPDAIGYVFLFGVVGSCLAITIYFHQKTFLKNWKIIAKNNLIFCLLWTIGGHFGYKGRLWQVDFGNLLGFNVFGLEFQLGNYIYAILPTTLISLVTIIIFNLHKSNLKFRNDFFKKE